jgi:hypothetical protein
MRVKQRRAGIVHSLVLGFSLTLRFEQYIRGDIKSRIIPHIYRVGLGPLLIPKSVRDW